MIHLPIQYDYHEQRRLLFPEYMAVDGIGTVRLTEEKVTLDAGDYTFDGYQEVTRCERKRDIRELYGNLCTSDQRRAYAAFDNFAASCEFPFLFIETPPENLWSSQHIDLKQAWTAVDRLFRLCADLGINLVWAGRRSSTIRNRRRLGELMLRYMIAVLVSKNLLH